jgi:hypothetical protein
MMWLNGHQIIANAGYINHITFGELTRFTTKKKAVIYRADTTENSLYFFRAAIYMHSGHQSTAKVGYINHGYAGDVIIFTSRKNTVANTLPAIENAA